MKQLKERCVVITGGAGGIGRCIAREFAQAGANIAIADLDEALMLECVQELRSLGVRASSHRVDVSKREDIERLRDEVLSEHGAVHILVNNAGITRYGSIEDMPAAEVDLVLGVNLMGVIHNTQVFLPILQEQDEAHIINISSMAAISGIPMQSIYCASKAAVRAFSQSLQAEMSGTNVGVSWIMPGAVRTGLLDKAGDLNTDVTQKLSSLLKRFAYRPERLATNVVKHIRKRGGELRLTPECHAFYAVNRASPSLIQATMARVKGLADKYE